MNMNLRPLFLVIGTLLMILAASMLIPALVDAYFNNQDWRAFTLSAFFTGFIGAGLFLTNRGDDAEHLNLKQAFLLTTLSWVSLVLFASLPFCLSGLDISLTDAWFESMSALTTTGATAFVGLDNMPPGILLWRSILQWLGGIGIIVMAMAVLPMLKIGGMQLFRTESSDKSEKILPRARQLCGAITAIYIGFTILCGWLLLLAGMSPFDAINHAMTTIATSGFSTHDASIGYFNSPVIEAVMIGFMLLSGLPYVLYIQYVRHRRFSVFHDSQVSIFLLMVASAVLAIFFWRHVVMDVHANIALREVAFNVVSMATTTGFSTADYGQWGSFAFVALFLFCVVGGCTGSTTGGIKIFRFQVLFKTAKCQINQLVQPHGVFRPLYHKKPVSDEAMRSVMSFFILFTFCFCVLAVLLSMHGLDYITTMSAAASMMANLGPGLGDVIGPAGNYSSLNDSVKWILSAGMLIGRLEIFTVLILFSPYFWRN